MKPWAPRSIPLALAAAIALVAWSHGGRPDPSDAPSFPDPDPGSAALFTAFPVDSAEAIARMHEPEPTQVSAPGHPDPTPVVDRTGPSRVRVTLRFGELDGRQQPVPELLRIDELGQRRPVEPLPDGTSGGAATHTFVVDEPGRYVTAWHAWRQVPGTRTWRVVRGEGPEVIVGPIPLDREIVLDVRPGELELDPSLDARKPGATYRFTAKDG